MYLLALPLADEENTFRIGKKLWISRLFGVHQLDERNLIIQWKISALTRAHKLANNFLVIFNPLSIGHFCT